MCPRPAQGEESCPRLGRDASGCTTPAPLSRDAGYRRHEFLVRERRRSFSPTRAELCGGPSWDYITLPATRPSMTRRRAGVSKRPSSSTRRIIMNRALRGDLDAVYHETVPGHIFRSGSTWRTPHSRSSGRAPVRRHHRADRGLGALCRAVTPHGATAGDHPDRAHRQAGC